MSRVETIAEVKKLLSAKKFSLQNEKILQSELAIALAYLNFKREHRFDENNIIDFFVDGIGIEVKIKGSRMQIFKQCQRYCQFNDIKAFILLTNRAMGFPEWVYGKPCFVINLAIGWL